MASEAVEEYLECVYDLSKDNVPVKTSEIASRLELSPASVTEMIQRLATEGYLDYKMYRGVTLTSKGRRVAERIKRKHRLLEHFLVRILGMKKEQSHKEACKLEHSISDDSIERLCQMMNNPDTCPDGDPIPKSDVASTIDDRPPSVPLSDLRECDSAVIDHLICSDSNKIRRLVSMGFVPGRSVTLEEIAPMGGPLLVKIEDSRIALAKDYARLVQVTGLVKGRRYRRGFGWKESR
jgi:DtxR family Mn-dependent transcriptional regulator